MPLAWSASAGASPSASPTTGAGSGPTPPSCSPGSWAWGNAVALGELPGFAPGAGRPGEGLGDAHPLGRQGALDHELRVGRMAPLGHHEAELERVAGDAIR